jgi:hypothetical protein
MATRTYDKGEWPYIWPLALIILPSVITDCHLVSLPTVIERGTGAESPCTYIYMWPLATFAAPQKLRVAI